MNKDRLLNDIGWLNIAREDAGRHGDYARLAPLNKEIAEKLSQLEPLKR